MENVRKKGQVDILTTAIVVFVIAFIGVLSYTIMNNFNTQLQDVDNGSASPESKSAFTNYLANYASGIDQGIVIALGLVFVLTLIFAGQINTNPAFFWIFLFLLIIIVATTSFLPQLFNMTTNNPDFAAARVAMPMCTFIASNLFQICAGMAVLILLVLFGKINKG